jgi:predicted nucleic acid-binding protein
MIVVSDTSPLNYLVLCDAIDVLPRLYGQVYIPQTIANELHHPATPDAVKKWLLASPPWLVIKNPASSDPTILLHPGETDAILLAQELHAHRLLMDERAGAAVAQSRGLHPIGTLGILVQAAKAGLVDLHKKIELLEHHTNFRMSAELKARALRSL